MAPLALRTLGAFAAFTGWTVVLAAALVASALLHLRLPIAKRVVVDWLHGVLAKEIRGELVIGQLERVSPRGIVARNVVLYDGEGRRVVQASVLVLDPDMRTLSAKYVRFKSARLEGGQVWLFDSGDGLPSLLTSFDSRTKGTGTGEPLQVEVDGIELARVRMQGDLLGLRDLRAWVEGARGSMNIARDVHVRIDSASGTLDEPFGFVGTFDSLTGTISTITTRGIDLHAVAHRGPERAEAHIVFASPAGEPGADGVFGLRVRGQQLTTTTLRAMRFDFVPELDVPLSGEVHLSGPFSNLAVHADLTSDAGPVRVSGRVSDSAGVAMLIASDRLQLGRLLHGAPELTVSGDLRIDTASEPAAETRLQLTLEPTTYDTWLAPGVVVHGALTEDGVRIDGAEGRSPGTRVQASGQVGFDSSLDLRVRAHVADIGEDPNLQRMVDNAHGRLDADVRVQTAHLIDSHLHFAGRVALGGLRYGELSAERLVLQGDARGDAQRPELRLDLRGKHVRYADYALGDPSLRVRGGPRNYIAEGQFVAEGRRAFNASARITAQGGSYLVDADTIEFAVGEGAWRGAVQGLRITPGQEIALELLRLASRSQRLEAHGVLREHGPDHLEAQLQDFDLAAVHALLGGRFALQRGRADAHVTLHGDVRAPDLHIQGALRDGELLHVAGVNALYFIAYRGGHLETDGEVDLGERGILHARGTGRLDPSLTDPVEALRLGSYDLLLTGEGLACTLWPALHDAGVKGKVSGSVRIEGTLQHPAFRGTAEADPLRLPGWDVLHATVQGSYQAGTLGLRVSTGDERGPIGSAEGQMQIDWGALLADSGLFMRGLRQGPWQLVGGTIERRLDRLPKPIGPLLPYPAVIAAQFELRKHNGVSSGRLRWNGLWERNPDDSPCGKDVHVKLRGSVALERGSSRVEAVALHGVRRVASFTSLVDTPVDRWMDQGFVEPPARFRSSGRVDIDAIQRLPYLCEYGNGSLRAELELDGGLSAEPILVATVDSRFYPRMVRQDRRKPVRVRSCQGDPIELHVELNADRTRLRASGGTTGCHGGPIEMRALLPVQWEELLVLPAPRAGEGIEASVRFEGAQLKPLLDRIPGVKNSDVLARGHVELSGPVSDPRSSGRLDIAGGRFYLVATGQELTDIDASVTFRGNWAKLDYLRARQEDGTLDAAGGIGFAGIVPDSLRVALRTENLPIKREGVDMAWITASAAVDADITRRLTRAAINLQSLELRLPDTSNRALQALGPHPDVEIVSAEPEPPGTPYPIELVIAGDRGLTVRRNDFEANIATELAVAYRDPDLNVGGHIEFVGGEFEVFGKRFDIGSGALRFDGGRELNPDVYLLATQKRDASGSPVTVSVTGTLAEPVVTFQSDVCPGDLGAVTYLVSGRCAADDPDLAQESGDARSSMTSGLMSGVLTLGAQRELGELLPRIAIESTSQSQRVRAGFSSAALVPKFMRNLVKRVYVQGGVGVSTQSEDTTGAVEEASGTDPLDFLIELYFPHSIVGSGRFAQETWGLDVTWEP
jgi:hypothetical protein